MRCYAGFNIFRLSCNPHGIGEVALGSLVSVLSEEMIGRELFVELAQTKVGMGKWGKFSISKETTEVG